MTMNDTTQMRFLPARLAEGRLVSVGMKLTAAIASASRWVLEPLYEASADVGTWVVSRSSAQVQARVRSHFL